MKLCQINYGVLFVLNFSTDFIPMADPGGGGHGGAGAPPRPRVYMFYQDLLLNRRQYLLVTVTVTVL